MTASAVLRCWKSLLILKYSLERLLKDSVAAAMCDERLRGNDFA